MAVASLVSEERRRSPARVTASALPFTGSRPNCRHGARGLADTRLWAQYNGFVVFRLEEEAESEASLAILAQSDSSFA